MVRRTFEAAVVAVGGIVAIALGAVTLRPASRPSGTTGSGERDGVGGGGSREGVGGGGSSGGSDPPRISNGFSEIELLNLGIEIPFELFLLAVAAVVGIVVLGSLLAYLLGYWRRPIELLGSLGLFVAVVSLVWGFPSFIPRQVPRHQPGLGIPTREGEMAGYSSPPSILLLVVGLVLAGILVALLRRDSDEGSSQSKRDEEPNLAAVGRAAGQAADHIEMDAATDNEVYRVWKEMTSLLDVSNPETSSPREFATVAAEAGMDERDVRELTRLFEDVRYGGQTASSEYEHRAVDVFRRIETTYTET